jgi:OFA family oxalate/formate antiporter-like MFS transporter
VTTTAAGRSPRFYLGWTVVAVACLSTFAQVSFFNPVLGVFMPALTKDFGWGRTEISGAMTVGSLLGAFLSPVFGPLTDRHGSRVFLFGGSIVMAICLALLAAVQDVWQFYILYAVGRGIASGIVGLAATVTVSKWFIRRRGFAVGVTTLGTRLGFAVMPIGVQLIIGGWGWREAWLALAAIVLVLGILPALKFLPSTPERAGLLPDGDGHPPAGEFLPSTVHAAVSEVSWTREEALRTRAFWLVTIAVSLQAWAGGAINLHQIPHLVDRGLSPEAAALVISLLAMFAAAGSLLEGLLDTVVGARWTLVVGLVGSALGMVFLMNVHGIGMALVYAGAYGVAFGLMVTSSQVVFADYFGRDALGAIRGASAPMVMTLNAIGPVVAGAAYDLTGSYLAAFIPFTFAYLLGAAFLIVAHKPRLPAGRVFQPESQAAGGA